MYSPVHPVLIAVVAATAIFAGGQLRAEPAIPAESAISEIRQRVEAARTRRDRSGEAGAMLDLAALYQRSGNLRLAIRTLEQAARLADEAGEAALKLRADAARGATLSFSQRAPEAEPLLRSVIERAAQTGDTRIAAQAQNDLGNLLAARQDTAAARAAYREASQLASKAGDELLRTKAEMNLGGLAIRGGDRAGAESVRQALQRARGLPDSLEKAALLLAAAAHLDATHDRANAKEALDAALDANRLAERFGDRRTAAEALGRIGSLYGAANRPDEALRATRQASLRAQEGQAPDVQYRLAWQEGRFLAALGRRAEAIAAYRRAIASADGIRHDLAISLGNENRGSSFREALGPLFFQLADLLLQQAADESDAAKKQAALREARDTVELLKSAELIDYFQDDCVNLLRSKTAGIEKISSTAAIVYLIPLPDRAELLVGFAGGWEQFAIGVSERELTATIRAFRQHLETRTSYEYLIEARKLYDWLIRPMHAALERHAIDTLVFVPDGAARTIPLGALHDGSDFLLSRYAIAVSPGATLTDPHTVERKAARLLLAGLSDPVQGFLPMNAVPRELAAIHEIHRGPVLLNRQFRADKVAARFEGDQYSIVHLASHGRFERDASKTFILTHDSRLSLDDLERMIRPGQFRGRPVELLTLSACQTAAGDDRAALGMAGVAVKAGARSAIASLWFVNDQSSSELIASFYRTLWQEPSLSKAQALQRAQQAMLASRAYAHPCYWAPYLVIGNWL